MASASALVDTQEKCNGIKLSRLLIDGGTETLRRTFDSIHPPASLQAVLHTNKPLLNTLRTRRLLYSSQWDKLYPPGGAAPDSNTFDITLLFVLLRNICRLRAPATGWDALPPAADVSQVANLARIKYYRNQVYGHVTGTGVSKADFQQYWNDISGALKALGADKVAIDNLKSSPIGSNDDYIALLTEFSCDVKEIVKTVDTNVETVKEDVSDVKAKVQTVDTNVETVKDEVSDVKEILKTVDTNVETVKEDVSDVKEIVKTVDANVETVKEDVSDVKAKVQTVDTNVETVKEVVCDVNQKVETIREEVRDLKAEVQKQNVPKQASLIETLSKYNFVQHTETLVDDQFQKGTRKWILDEIENFYTNPEVRSRALVITALPGVGKSVLAAVACRNAEEKGRLGACHFVQHNNSQRNNPRVIIESIVRHLCNRVEGFEEKPHGRLSSLQPDIRKRLDEMNLETLICDLVEEPLGAMQSLSTEQTFVIIIDALDEIEPSSREEFISVLLRKSRTLPKWIKFVLTSRSTKQLLVELPHVTVVNIEAADSNNNEDIRLYLSKELQLLYHDEPIEKLETITAKLTERSQGIFLYAHFAIESAKKRNLSLSETSELFPKGISSVYEEYLTRSQTELNLDEEKFINFLEGITAAQAPLPLPLVLQILGINKESRQQKKVARKALNSLSLLFPEERKCISIFHKSLTDWLTIAEDEDDGHDFCVKVADGHRVLAEHCLKVLRAVKNHKSFPPELSDSENYALTFGFLHMLEAGGYEEQLRACVQDLELLAAVWVARGMTTSRVPRQRKADMVQELERISDCCSLPVEDLSHLCKVMRAVRVQTDCPQFVLQCASYSPSSTGLSSKATQILSSPKYRNCIWMERQRIYSFKEGLYVVSCRSSEHTVTCVCVRGTSFMSTDCTIITLNVEDGRQLAEVYLVTLRFDPSIQDVQVLPSDKYVVVYQKYDRQLQLRDVQTLQIQRTFEVEDRNRLLSCCFVPGNKLAAGCEDETVRVWDVESGAAETTLQCPIGTPVYCTASQTGQLLTVENILSGAHFAVLWQPVQLAPHEIVSALYDPELKLDTALNFDFDRVSFTLDGKLVACTCAYKDRQFNYQSSVIFIGLYDVTTAQLLKYFPIEMYSANIIFIDDSHVLLNNQRFGPQMKVLSINDGSTQEVVAELSFACYKGTRECVAIDHDPRTLYKLTFHNLK